VRLVEHLANAGGHEFSVAVLGEAGAKAAAAIEPVLAGLRHIKEIIDAAAAEPVQLEFWPAWCVAWPTTPALFRDLEQRDPFSLAGGGRYDGLVGQFLGKAFRPVFLHWF